MVDTLPVNIDSSYADVPADPSAKLHQQAHDSVHTVVNSLAGGSSGQVLTKTSAGAHDFGWATPSGGGGSGTVTYPSVLVASADASAAVKASADFVCDGTADQMEINAAVDRAAPLQTRNATVPVAAQQRAAVVLSGGRFNCSDAILMRTGVRLTGQGWLTEIRAVSCNATGLVKLASVEEHLCQVDHLYLYGNYSSGGTCDAINFDMTGSTNAGTGTYPASQPDSYHHLTDLFIDGFASTATRNGIRMFCASSAFQRGNILSRIQMRNIGQHGIWMTSASDSLLDTIHIGTCGGSGFYIDTSNTRLTNVKAFYCDGPNGGFYIGGDNCSLSVAESQENHTGFRIDGANTVMSAVKADICRDDGIFVNRSRTTLSGFDVNWKTGMRYPSPTTNGLRFASGLSDCNIVGHVAATTLITNRVVNTAGNLSGSFLRVAGGSGAALVAVGDASGDSKPVTLTKFGVPLDGTDGTSQMVAAIASGEQLYHPGGTVLVSSGALSLNDGQSLFGAGRGKSILKRANNGVLLDINGIPGADSAYSNHKRNSTVRDLLFHGNDTTGSLLQLWHTGDHIITGNHFFATFGRAIDGVELWDTRIDNNTSEYCGDNATAAPVFDFRNASSATGQGSGSDNSNNVYITGSRLETFRYTAISISQGVSNSNSPNGFYITNNKVESRILRAGAMVYVGPATVNLHIDKLLLGAGEFDAGFSTAVDGIYAEPATSWSIRNVTVFTGSSATINRGLFLWSSNPGTVENVVGTYATAPTSGYHVVYAGGGPYSRRGNTCTPPTIAEVLDPSSTVYMQSNSSALAPVMYTGSATLRVSDANGVVETNAATANTLTIPPNTSVPFPVGAEITVYQYGVGLTTISGGVGVTVRGLTTTGGQYQRRLLRQRATNEWYVTAS